MLNGVFIELWIKLVKPLCIIVNGATPTPLHYYTDLFCVFYFLNKASFLGFVFYVSQNHVFGRVE